MNVNFGLRTLFLLFAALLFALAAFGNQSHFRDLIAWGLAAFAFSFLLADIGWDRRYGAQR